MYSRFMRICSTVLVLVLLINLLPAQCLTINTEDAAQSDPNNTATTSNSFNATNEAGSEVNVGSLVDVTQAEVTVLGEAVERRSEFSKEFLLSNGLRVTTVYPDAVHYSDNGQWLEIDNTLRSSGIGSKRVYTNTAGLWDVSLPNQLSAGNYVTLSLDGHVLRFGLAGEMKASTGSGPALEEITADAVAQSIDAGILTLNSAADANAQVHEIDRAKERALFEHQEMYVETLRSRLVYDNVYANTDIIYDLQSNQLKESLVLEQYDSSLYGYQYILNVGNLVPILGADGHIDFYDEKQETVIFTMPAPYLVDSAGESCHDIQVLLEGQGKAYMLQYILPQAWLADSDRVWPVVLDPAIRPAITSANVCDRTVAEFGSIAYDSALLECGRTNALGRHWAFVKYASLPDMKPGDVIVNAKMQLAHARDSAPIEYITVHKVNGTWESASITWSNKPGVNATVEDYAKISTKQAYYWDVTDIVRDWYSGSNTGMMFKALDSLEGSATDTTKFYSVDYDIYDLDVCPVLTITYRSNSGLEDYWGYTSASAGRAGTGFVNNYSGNLVWVHNDLGFDGNRMPVSISHIYNTSEAGSNKYGLGYGWKTNYHQFITSDTDVNGTYYIWEDGDGTKHYFRYKSSSAKYEDESGLGLTLTFGSGNSRYTITDKLGNKSIFDDGGRLVVQRNYQQTVSDIEIEYDSGAKISKITDGAGRKYTFTYDNTGGLLTQIAFWGIDSPKAISTISFSYLSTKLSSVTYADGKTTAFTYSDHYRLNTVSNVDASKLVYTYDTASRVSSVKEMSGSVEGAEISFAYAHNQTTITDHKGNKETHQFNNWGNTTAIYDSEGRAAFAQYATEAPNSGGTPNQLILQSEPQSTVANYILNNSFEAGNAWTEDDSYLTYASCEVANGTAYSGSKSLRMVCNASNTVSGVKGPSYVIPAGEAYTFSAYVTTGEGAVWLQIDDSVFRDENPIKSETLKANRPWTRLEVTYYNDSGSSKTITPKLMSAMPGTCYMDCLQLEKAEVCNKYNMVGNGDFREGGIPPAAWTRSWNSTANDKVVSVSAAVPQLDGKAYQIVGSPSESKYLSQIVKISGSSGDVFTLGAWAKADSAPLHSYSVMPRAFGIQVIFTNSTGVRQETLVASFNTGVGGDAWQYAASTVVAPFDYASIEIQLRYSYNTGTAYFDGVQLYRTGLGTQYRYNSDGNVSMVIDPNGQTYGYTYNGNDLTKTTLNYETVETYTYDAYHNMKTSTKEGQDTYSYEYDAYGNVRSVTSTNSAGVSIKTQYTYSPDHNYLSTVKDSYGNTTKYFYDTNTGVLNAVEDPNGGWIDYCYDDMQRLEDVEQAVGSYDMRVSYTYENDHLVKLQSPGTTYDFTYNGFGLRTGVKIGTRVLANYFYTDRDNNLSRLDYGNGHSVQYIYNDQGQVTQETYTGNGANTSILYRYDSNGRLADLEKAGTHDVIRYRYDTTGRLTSYSSMGTTGYICEYEYYDSAFSVVRREQFSSKYRTSRYAYNALGQTLQTSWNGNCFRDYSYDSYGRPTEWTTRIGTSNQILKNTLVYSETDNQTTGGRIESFVITLVGQTITCNYTYDGNGNITSVSQNGQDVTYRYDEANQLIREDNEALGFTWVWTYDGAGNIKTCKQYSYTTGTPTTLLDTVNYSYGNAEWGDLLTHCDERSFYYDAIGNLLSDSMWSYTWEQGRRLKSMSRNGMTWNFTYGPDGMRTSRSNGTTTWNYVYNGSQLMAMTNGSTKMYFTYDAAGRPVSIEYNGTTYYYVLNVQGDVVTIVNSSGSPVVNYTYNAWGKLCRTTGSMTSTLGTYNPLRYRGYVYDTDTGLYYLQSRYYNPEMGRFLNADSYASTGQGILGNNMFAYCRNNPVCRVDVSGDLDQECFDEDSNPFNDLGGPNGTGTGGGGGVTNGSNAGGLNGGTPIYRYGGTNPGNLTPRASDNSLSFSTNYRSGSGMTTMEQVNSTGVLYAVKDGPSHVSVYPIGASVSQWFLAGRDSIWTAALKEIMIKC